MGAWGATPFDNDAARDFLENILNSPSRAAMRAVNRVLGIMEFSNDEAEQALAIRHLFSTAWNGHGPHLASASITVTSTSSRRGVGRSLRHSNRLATFPKNTLTP